MASVASRTPLEDVCLAARAALVATLLTLVGGGGREAGEPRRDVLLANWDHRGAVVRV